MAHREDIKKQIQKLLNGQKLAVLSTHQSGQPYASLKEINGIEKDEILSLYLSKHPYLQEFATSPTCALVDIAITTYVMMKNFQHVMELHIDQ